jgi:hypothetical protein
MNIRAFTVFVSDEALVSVKIEFICENPHTHSMVEIDTPFTMLTRGSRDPRIFQEVKRL